MPAYRALLKATRNHGMRTLARWNARVFPSGQCIRLESGIPLWVPPDPNLFGYLLGSHDQHVAEAMRQRIRPGDCCVDVGANIGYFSCLMSGWCGEAGRVIAYEPEDRNFQCLQMNAALAAERGRNIVPVQAAVSNVSGDVRLLRSPLSTHHRIVGGGEAADSEFVPSVVLDKDLLTRGFAGPIRVMKIDVEGHEAHVLLGCEQFVSEGRIQCMLIEVFPGQVASEVGTILARWQARVTVWLDGRWREMPVGEVPYRTDVLAEFEDAAGHALP